MLDKNSTASEMNPETAEDQDGSRASEPAAPEHDSGTGQEPGTAGQAETSPWDAEKSIRAEDFSGDAETGTRVEALSGESAGSDGRRSDRRSEFSPGNPETASGVFSENPQPAQPAPSSDTTETGRAENPDNKEPASAAQRCFAGFATIAPVILLALFLLQVWMWLIRPPVFLSAEQANLQMIAGTKASAIWLTPMADAATTALPGFTWFAGLMSFIALPDTAHFPLLLCLGAALLCLLGTYILALACGLGKEAAFAAGLLLLASPGFAGGSHILGAPLLTAGLTALALGLLITGWKKDSSWLLLPSGFLLTALAGFSGGLIPFALPLLASIFFVLWTGRCKRAQRPDALAGFFLILVCILGWIGMVMLTGTRDNYLGLLMQQLTFPFSGPFRAPADPLETPLIFLALALSPWPLLLLTVSWNRVFKNSWTAIKASRKEHCGSSWLWISFVTGLALCMLASHKNIESVAPLLPVAAVLLAGALLRLSGIGSRVLFVFIGLLCVVKALAMTASTTSFLKDYLPAVQLPDVLAPLGVLASAATMHAQPLLLSAFFLLVMGVILIRFTRTRNPGGSLLVVAALTTLLVQPVMFQLVPAVYSALPESAKILPSPAEPQPAEQGNMPEIKQVKPLTPEAAPIFPDTRQPAAPLITPDSTEADTPDTGNTAQPLITAPASPETAPDTAAAPAGSGSVPAAPAPAGSLTVPATAAPATPPAPTAPVQPEVSDTPAPAAPALTPAPGQTPAKPVSPGAAPEVPNR